VLRLALRPYLAFLLLLCLTRTLLPEAWILALHTHKHTTEEPTIARVAKRQPGKALHAHEHTTEEAIASPGKRPAGKNLLSAKHTHCQTEQFYQVPFQLAPRVAVPLPRHQLSYRRLAVPTQLACSAAMLRRTALRGPPQA
jgi:hypothetical protein